MAKINLVSSQAITAMESFVKDEMTAGRKVSRGNLLIGLGYAEDEVTPSLKSVISAIIESGEAPTLKLVQREGVVTSDYRRGGDVRKEQIEKNKADRAAKKQQSAADKEAKKNERLKAQAEKQAAAKLAEESKKQAAATTATAAANDTAAA